MLEHLHPRDFNYPLDFIKHSRDSNIPVAVIGNGGSLNELSRSQIDELNNYRLFRCNWAFKDPSGIKKQYTMWFSQVYSLAAKSTETDVKEGGIKTAIDAACMNGDVMIYRYQTNILYNGHPACTFATPNRYPVWPTTGIQMFLYATFKTQTPAIYMAGIDMYTHKRPKGELTKQQILKYLKEDGKSFSQSGERSAGISMFKENLTMIPPNMWRALVIKQECTFHFLEIDILLLLLCFHENEKKQTPVHIYSCKILNIIKTYAVENSAIIENYFNKCDKKSSYNMWRLISKIIIETV